MSDIYHVADGSQPQIPENNGRAVIKVIGIGGGGGNTVQHMVEEDVKNVQYIVVNTDMQALNNNLAENRIQIGVNTTRGLGSGSNPDTGRAAAEESRDAIKKGIEKADIVFLTAGMGGGTGTGASPIVAEIARKETGALTVAIVTKPYSFEGKKQLSKAEEGIAKLKNEVDALIVIPNDKLLKNLPKNITLYGAFQECNRVLKNAVKGISDLIEGYGYINLDFNDIKSVLLKSGTALIGMGSAEGENAVAEAISAAVDCPLLEDISNKKAKGVIANISVSPDFPVLQFGDLGDSLASRYTTNDTDFKYGICFDSNLKPDQVNVTILLAGLEEQPGAVNRHSINKPSEMNMFTQENSDGVGSFASMFTKQVEETATNEEELSIKKKSPFENSGFELPSFLTKKAD